MTKIAATFSHPTRTNHLLAQAVLVALLIGGSYLVIYNLGGADGAVDVINLVPIMVAGYFWQLPGALVAALLCSFSCGPLMPQLGAQGLSQPTAQCLVRMVIFCLVGGAFGMIFAADAKLKMLLEERRIRDNFTGLYNEVMLGPSLSELLENGRDFTLIIAALTNLDGITNYVSEGIVKKVVDYFLAMMSQNFGEASCYSLKNNRFAFVISKDDEMIIKEKLERLVSQSFA